MENKTFCIGIDGPAGAGKTTTAKAVAKTLNARLNFVYVDTGAFYRAAAVYLTNQKLDVVDFTTGKVNKTVLQTCLTQNPFTLDAEWRSSDRQVMLVNNSMIFEDDMRTNVISAAASILSTEPAVRNIVTEAIHRVSAGCNCVMEGRDVCTNIRTDADCKIFLTADLATRVKRRCLQMLDNMSRENEITVNTETVWKQMEQRDYLDSNRKINPLRPDPASIHIDNTHMTLNQTVDTVMFAAAYRGIPVLPCLEHK